MAKDNEEGRGRWEEGEENDAVVIKNTRYTYTKSSVYWLVCAILKHEFPKRVGKEEVVVSRYLLLLMSESCESTYRSLVQTLYKPYRIQRRLPRINHPKSKIASRSLLLNDHGRSIAISTSKLSYRKSFCFFVHPTVGCGWRGRRNGSKRVCIMYYSVPALFGCWYNYSTSCWHKYHTLQKEQNIKYNVIKKSEQQRTNSIFKFKLHTPPSQPGRTTDHNIITSSSSSHLQSTCECVIPYHLSIAIAPVGIECKCLYIFNLIGPDFEIAL